MNNRRNEINDDEIRIISPMHSEEEHENSPNSKTIFWIIIIIVMAAAVLLVYCLTKPANEKAVYRTTVADNINPDLATLPVIDPAADRGYVAISDTIVDMVSFKIFTPVNLTPSLYIGGDIGNKSSTVMAFQAADIRKDNGEIVGAFVLNGELISKGQSKAGFCSIIGGRLTVGVADATPLLEQALESNGYFFRQYPLVVGGQIVENKLKGKSLRKALAEINGQMVVVVGEEIMSLHDFSQSLIDLGATNAIYLTGSSSYGFAIDEAGNKIEVGIQAETPPDYTNFIIWK